MILITRLNGSQYYTNAERIASLEATPDTVLTLIDGTKLVVKEAPELLVERIVEYKRKILANQLISKIESGG